MANLCPDSTLRGSWPRGAFENSGVTWGMGLPVQHRAPYRADAQEVVTGVIYSAEGLNPGTQSAEGAEVKLGWQ